jgi:hypothetical protein
MKPTKPKKNEKPASKFPKMYIAIAVAAALVIVVVITLLTGGNTGGGAGVVDETEAQMRWKESTGPTRKK